MCEGVNPHACGFILYDCKPFTDLKQALRAVSNLQWCKQACISEFKNGLLFQQLLQPEKEGNYKFILPEMIACSKKCLVMSYEESKLCADLSGYDNDTLYKITECIILLAYAMTINGILHMDLHTGNVGVRGNKMVIYDFGQMKDIRRLDKQIRERMVISKIKNDTKGYINCFVDDHKLTEQILQFIGEGSMYEQLTQCFKYMCMNNIEIDGKCRAILISSLKPTPFLYIQECIIEDNPEYGNEYVYGNGIRHYFQTMFPYDEFKELAELFD